MPGEKKNTQTLYFAEITLSSSTVQEGFSRFFELVGLLLAVLCR